jgi:hypothetical protein
MDDKKMPIARLKSEEGADDLANSPDMEPYLKFAMAVMQDSDPSPELEAIRRLRLEKRYVWRVASALKWAFADFDDLNVTADSKTLQSEDFEQLWNLLKLRPVQFCLFLKALIGPEEMKRVMLHAISTAGRIP